MKNLDVALNTIRAGLKEQPDSFALHKALAEILVQKGDYETAIEEYEYLLKQQPDSLVVANDLANLLSDHRTDKASIDRAYSIAKVLRNSPVASFQDTLGWIDYLRGDNNSAVSLLEEAATKLPNVGWVRYHLGMSYIASVQLEKASEQLKKALELADSIELQQKVRAAQEKLAVANWKREQKESDPK
jgi:predicted Zn-dependent protease